MNRYEVRLAGHLDPGWSEWFEGFTLRDDPDGSTTLTGPVIDQASLHGVLRRVAALGVDLISINVLDEDAIDHPSRTPHRHHRMRTTPPLARTGTASNPPPVPPVREPGSRP